MAKGARLRGVHREHRHRRPGADPRARRKNHAGVTVVVEPADYEHVLQEMRGERRGDDARFAQAPRRQGLRPHRRLRCRHQRLVCGETRRRGAGVARVCGQARASPALWREPASVGGLLRLGRRAPRRGYRRAAPGQGALLQQPQRHGRGLRAGGGACRRAAGRRHHQARQPVRCGDGADARGGLPQGAALRSGERLRRHRRAQRHHRRGRRRGDHQDLHRGRDRARRNGGGEGDLCGRRRTCAC